MHNNIPEPDPSNGSDPQIDPYERFNELAIRLQKHGDSPWNLLDDQLMDKLIGGDQLEVDPDFADLANSLRHLQLFSMIERDLESDIKFNTSEELLDDDVPIQEFEKSTVLGRFELREIIGRGSYGIVYRAFDRITRREVALKMPRPELRGLKTIKERFYREAASMSQLVHPGLVPLLDIGVAEGMPYLVSRLVNGPNLEQWLELTIRPISPKLAAVWIKQLAEAIDHLHLRNILHCDLKPSNILLEHPYAEDPVELPPEHLAIRVTDFGSASRIRSEKNSKTNDLQGTLCFMAPEQLQAKANIDARTDVYAISAILYEILTDKPVFDQSDPSRLRDDIAHKTPVAPRKIRPELPIALEAIALKGLSKQPEDRYQSAGELAQDLDAWLNYRTPQVLKHDSIRRTSLFFRRNRLIASALFLMAVGVTTSVILRTQQNRILHRLDVERVRLSWWNNYVSSMETAQKYLAYNNKDRLNEILDSTIKWPAEAELNEDPREFSWFYLNHERRKMSDVVNGLPENTLHYVAAVAPVSKSVWIGGVDGFAREVDTQNLKVIRQLKVSPNGPIDSIAVSPDNQYLAVGNSNGHVHLYSIKKELPVSNQKDHGNQVVSLAFTSDSNKLISGGFDGKLVIRDLQQNTRLTYQTEPPVNSNGIPRLYAIAVLPDNKNIAVCSGDNRIRIIDLTTAKLTNTLFGHFDEVVQVIVSTNLRWLVSASKDRTIGIWDLKTMELANQISMDQNLGQFNSASQTGMRTERFSPFVNVHGMNAVAIDLGSGQIDVFGIPSGSRISRLYGHSKPVTTLVYQPWNRTIASIARDFDMRIWDQPCRDMIPDIRFFEIKQEINGNETIFLSDDSNDRSQTLIGNQKVKSFRSLINGEFKDSSTAFYGKYLGVIKKRFDQTPSNQVNQTFQFAKDVLQSDKDSYAKNVEWQEVANFPLKLRLTDPILHGHKTKPYFLVIDGDQNLYLIDLTNDESPKPIFVAAKVQDACFVTEKNEILVIRSLESTQLFWNIDTGTWTKNSGEFCESDWTTASYSPDGSLIAIYKVGGKLLIYNSKNFRMEKEIHLPEIGIRRVRNIVWSPDSKQILVSMSVKDMFLIDYKTGKPLIRWDFGLRMVHDVYFSNNGESIWVLEGTTIFDRLKSSQRRLFRFYAPRNNSIETLTKPESGQIALKP
jgi:serine/threonine protein kinase